MSVSILWYFTKTQQVMVFERLIAIWNLKPYQWLFTLSYAKSAGPPGTVTASFAQAWLCNILHWPFGKYWFTKLCRSSKYWHMSWLCRIKRSHSLLSPLISSEKPLSIAKLPSSWWWWIRVSPNSNFHMKAPILSLAANAVSCFPWSSLYSFSRKCLPDPQVWITVGCQSSLQVRMIDDPWKERLVPLQPGRSALFLETDVLSVLPSQRAER